MSWVLERREIDFLDKAISLLGSQRHDDQAIGSVTVAVELLK